MASMNRVILAGNLTRNPELRQLPSGSAVCEFGLAINDRYTNRAGEQVEQTCFTEIVAWNRQAEVCGEYLAKGSLVLVDGRLQYDAWETEDGQKRSKLRVVANRVQFLGRPKRDGAAEEPETGAAKAETEDEALPF